MNINVGQIQVDKSRSRCASATEPIVLMESTTSYFSVGLSASAYSASPAESVGHVSQNDNHHLV